MAILEMSPERGGVAPGPVGVQAAGIDLADLGVIAPVILIGTIRRRARAPVARVGRDGTAPARTEEVEQTVAADQPVEGLAAGGSANGLHGFGRLPQPPLPLRPHI